MENFAATASSSSSTATGGCCGGAGIQAAPPSPLRSPQLMYVAATESDSVRLRGRSFGEEVRSASSRNTTIRGLIERYAKDEQATAVAPLLPKFPLLDHHSDGTPGPAAAAAAAVDVTVLSSSSSTIAAAAAAGGGDSGVHVEGAGAGCGCGGGSMDAGSNGNGAAASATVAT